MLKKGETSSSKLSTCNYMLQVDNLLLEVSPFFNKYLKKKFKKKGESSSSNLSTFNEILQVVKLLLEVSPFLLQIK